MELQAARDKFDGFPEPGGCPQAFWDAPLPTDVLLTVPGVPS
jgi:hypothetical protein